MVSAVKEKSKKQNYNWMEQKVRHKYFQNKHNLLIFLRNQNELGNYTTVVQIENWFGITTGHAYKLLEKLEEENDIVKGEKITINGQEYYNYIVTEKAKQELEVLLRSVHKKHFVNINLGKLDFIAGLMKHVEKIAQQFLPEGDIRATFLQKMAKEIQYFLSERSRFNKDL
jgi:DNA-binding PadR family transcriptional regulator